MHLSVIPCNDDSKGCDLNNDLKLYDSNQVKMQSDIWC